MAGADPRSRLALTNPINRPKDEVVALTQQLKEIVEGKGHDGIIVHWDDSIPGDVDAQGRDLKLLRNVFDTQVVDYRTPPSRQAAAAPAEAPAKPAPAAIADPAILATQQEATRALETGEARASAFERAAACLLRAG